MKKKTRKVRKIINGNYTIEHWAHKIEEAFKKYME